MKRVTSNFIFILLCLRGVVSLAGDPCVKGEAIKRAEVKTAKLEAEKTAREEKTREPLAYMVGEVEFVFIPAGTFMMGSPAGTGPYDEHPEHQVTISAFMMSKYEITQAVYRRVTGTNPSVHVGPNFPVEMVSWNDAMKFCARFGRMYGAKVRLPSEAEWEYACRAGSSTRFFWGNNVSGRYCWYKENAGGVTHQVGTRLPNQWELCDIIGNVTEWCLDLYDENYYEKSPTKDPMGPAIGEVHIFRGGSYIDGPRYMRTRFRNGGNTEGVSQYCGFRIVLPFRYQDPSALN